MLDLPAEVENAVREYAAREGVSVTELIARTFPSPSTPASQNDTLTQVRNRIAQWQQEDKTYVAQPSTLLEGLTPSEVLFRQWDLEDAALTEEQRQAAEDQWKAFQEGINTERTQSGMRTIF